ncbi:MAG: peptidoglycan-binding protein, partial [Novosphingobium sp.]|nr:peptidoglycan-binding protein [Novosphingobium sp.]
MVRELAGNDRQSPFASMRSLVSPWLHRIAAVLALVAVCAIIGASPSRAERECANNYEAFVKLPNQKAMVHGSDSNQCYWAYRAQTLKQAQKLAMANCRKQAKKCAIVDVYGDIAKQNKQVQQNLKELGFYDGPVDGKIGPGSRRAVLAYQNARNLKEDGKVTDELAKRLQKDHQILTYSENSVCRFATTAGSNGLSRWETQSKYSIYVIEAKRRGLSETRCDTVLNRTGKNSSTSYTSASICRFATKEGVNGLSQWDTSSSFAHYIAEARKRGLTLSACDTIVGRKVKINMASIDENTLCRFATRLGSDGLSEWESGVKYKTYVEEAGKRSLTLTRCDSLQGRRTRPQAATVANEESPSTPLNRNLCRAALAIYPSGLVTWEKSSGLADQVSKAKAARLTPERCAEMLQIKYKVATEEPIGTDNDTKSAEIALARFDDKAMCA